MPLSRTWIGTCAAVCGLAMMSLNGSHTLHAQTTQPAQEPPAKVVRLWEGDTPEFQGTEQSDKPTNDVPTLTIYPPADGKNNGAALVICPGGGYGHLADHEGRPVAEWFASVGGTGLVLRYRLGPKYHHPAEMFDVQRAIRLARAHSAEWGIDPKRVGVLGFSAGGHLASTAATHFDDGDPAAKDPADQKGCRPDFAVLVYPVISLKPPYGHMGSRRNLLGDTPDEKLVDLMSNDEQVTDKTPPTFLIHASDDKTVPIQNSLQFATALAVHKVKFEMRVFAHGGHGFGLGTKDPEVSTWPQACELWLDTLHIFTPEALRENDGKKG